MNRILLALVCICLVAAGCSDDSSTGGPVVFPAFTDNFDDGVVDTAIWEVGGQVTEGGGNLQLRRESPADYIRSRNAYNWDWKITMVIRLNTIHWNDMYHGISLLDDDGAGVSFGFSKYGKIYKGTHNGSGGISFAYGPDGSNQEGTWQTWVIEKSNGMVTLEVDGQPVSGLSAVELSKKTWISLPGYHSDGDGGSLVGMTSSDVNSFSIEGN